MNSNNFSLSSNPLCTFCQSNSNQARKHIFDQVIFKICTIFGQWSDGFAIQKYREMIDFRLQLSLFAFSVKIIEIVWFKSLSLHKWLNFKKKISNQSKSFQFLIQCAKIRLHYSSAKTFGTSPEVLI